MLRLISTGLSTVFCIASATAGDLAPLGGKTFVLAGATGILYYTEEADGLRVVATVSSSQDATPLRVSAVLADGQTLVFAVPASSGAASTVEIRRNGNRLAVLEADPAVIATTSDALDPTLTGGIGQ
ncbi:MAG: hypothetical protein H7Y08_05915 [Rhizobiaceae bacterium]|nr:hypothetical protein [Rhizobiaceae bacterium]